MINSNKRNLEEKYELNKRRKKIDYFYLVKLSDFAPQHFLFPPNAKYVHDNSPLKRRNIKITDRCIYNINS